MDESMGRKPRSSMGAWYGGASTGVPDAPHHLATMATHPHHTKERCPTRHLEQNFFDLPQPEQGMRIMGAYARRNMEDIDAIRRHTSQLEDGTVGIAYQMGLLGLVPPEQFNGGTFQQYYDQGYNTRPNQGD